MKKLFKIKGMHCNSCERLIEIELKDRVSSIKVSYAKNEALIDFDPEKISEKEITESIKKLGYEVISQNSNAPVKKDRVGLFVLIGVSIFALFFLYYLFGSSIKIPEFKIPEIGENVSLVLLFIAGLLVGFHCVSMCGGFVVSYTAKNALNGHKSLKQHLVYGGSKVVSYAIIGGIFGLIGGIIAFSTKLRGWVAILAGLFMIFYALSMCGIAFFRRFQFNPKFLSKVASRTPKGPYAGPFFTGLLNGLFIACGPLQAMYLYAAGTGSFVKGATSLAVFGFGTIPVMLGFGSLATVISHSTTRKILKISAVIVLILGLVMLNRGLALTGTNFGLSSIKPSSNGNVISGNIVNGVQEINMNVDASGYHPNSFVLKKGIPVKWNVNVKELTGCNSELVVNDYKIDARLKQGLNVFEFTPDKVGTVRFSCGMGMLQGSFIVTESGEATQQQINSATPKSSGSCGMGSGCGCGM